MLDLLRGSHIVPVVDQYYLVLVGLGMLRDCSESRSWESSFIAVNMHPEYRVGIEDWLKKIDADVKVAEKFEVEDLNDLESLRPPLWTRQPLDKRKKWMGIIDKANSSWDVDMISALRTDGMPLDVLKIMFKVYSLEKQIASSAAKTYHLLSSPNRRRLKFESHR